MSAFAGFLGHRRGGRSSANFGVDFPVVGAREAAAGGVRGRVWESVPGGEVGCVVSSRSQEHGVL